MTDFRIGHGYDVHALADGLRLVLGGIEIPHTKGCVAHSDGDVAIHAVCDALLGAAALGDIGQHFPPSDPQWKGADSRKLLKAVMEIVRREGWQIGNCDATIVAERPKIGPFSAQIRASVAECLGVDVSLVSVKAKTNEKLDAVGAEKGMVAFAAVLLMKE